MWCHLCECVFAFTVLVRWCVLPWLGRVTGTFSPMNFRSWERKFRNSFDADSSGSCYVTKDNTLTDRWQWSAICSETPWFIKRCKFYFYSNFGNTNFNNFTVALKDEAAIITTTSKFCSSFAAVFLWMRQWSLRNYYNWFTLAVVIVKKLNLWWTAVY